MSTNLEEALEYSKSLPVLEKIMSPSSASQRTDNSWTFLSRPPLRLEKVTCLLVVFSILLISIFPRPMLPICLIQLYTFRRL